MKKITALLLFISVTLIGEAQISGYMGKRFAVGLNLGVNVPPISSLFDESSDYGFNPKFILHGEYQVGRFYSLKAEVGYSSTNIPYQLAGQNLEESQGTTMIIIGARKGIGMPMPVSSSYFGYGLGMFISNTPEVATSDGWGEIYPAAPSESVSIFVLNLEWGRRFVFENGIFIDGSAVFNLNTAVLGDAYEISEIVKKQMGSSALFNLKIGVGFIL